MNEDVRLYPLVGSIQNDVGIGFLGNQAVAATANPLKVRVATMSTGYASARGGVEGRLSYAPNIVEFKHGVSFLIAQQPLVLLIGFINRLEFVETVAECLAEYSGIVVLDPVIGDGQGLYVSEETAIAIRKLLVPVAQLITPNRFRGVAAPTGESAPMPEVLRCTGCSGRSSGARCRQSAVGDFVDAAGGERRNILNLFGNAYGHTRITTPFYTAAHHGAGDVFAAAVATFTALGAAPFIAATLATTFATLAVKAGTSYGFDSVDPVPVHELFKPHDVYDNQIKALSYVSRYGVETSAIPPAEGQGSRLGRGQQRSGDAVGA